MAKRTKSTPFLADGKTKKPAGQKPKFYHAIEVNYVGATNYKPSRITFKSARFKESKAFSYDNYYDDVPSFASALFKFNKWPVSGFAETPRGYVFFSLKFESVKTLKPF